MYSDSYDTSGGCTRVSGVERMLIRKISDVEKFTKNSRRFMCRRFVGLGMLFLCFCMELLIGRNVYASQLQSGINDESALNSSVVWQFADQYDYGEIDETLKELFPKERLDFKEILIGVLSGDITFSVQLLKQLVKEQFSYAFASSRQNLIHILMLAIMTAVFTNFARAFGNGQAADTGFYVMYLLIVALCLNSCQIIMDWVEEGISNLIQFMTVFGPIYFPAVAVAKGSVTAISFYSLTLFLVYLVCGAPGNSYLYFSKYAELFDEGIVSEQTGRVDKDCTCVDYEDNSGGCSGAESGAEPFKSCYGYSQEKCVDEGH